MARAEEPRCPLCGESVVVGARRCDNCGAELGADEEASFRALFKSLGADAEGAGLPVPPRPPPGSQADEATRAAAGSTLYLCPSCGAFVSSADARCPRCGADLATDATPPVETGMCPHCGSAIPVTAEVCPACDRPVAPEDEEAIPGLCPNCGSVAPTGRQTCAVCGASLRPSAVPAPAALPGPPPPPEGPPRPPVRPRRVSAPAAPEVRERTVREPRAIPAPPEPEASVHEEPPPRPGPGARTRPARMPVHGGPPEPQSASLREMSAIATLLTLPAAAAAGAAQVPGREWGDLLAFGLLLGIAAGLTLPDLREPMRDSRTLGAFLGGLALLAAAPVLGLAGAASVAGDGALLAAGGMLLGAVAWRFRAGVGPFLLWIGGLLLLAVLAISPFVDVRPRPPGVDGAVWGFGGALAFGAAAFVVLRRWLRSAASARLARGDAAYARREYETATASYDAAVVLARRAGFDLPAGWYGKGAALVAAGRFDEAIVALDRALAANPGNEVAWINKGTALTRLGRTNEALKCYNSAIKVNPQYEVAWNNKANALARLGRPELALACYEKALEIDPAYRTAWVNKGFVLAKLGRFEEAAACADAALRLTTGAAASA